MSEKGWVRHRFHANPRDWRPVRFPPPGPAWLSGEDFDGRHSIVVAYLPPGVAVTDWWPEATEIDSRPEASILYTSRFPKPEWWEDPRERKWETDEQRRARLKPLLEQLRAAKQSVLLDLCEMLLMVSEETDGMFKWDHPRVLVHIRLKSRMRKTTTKKLESS